MTEESWTTFSFQGHRKRRAEAACVHCHAKKVTNSRQFKCVERPYDTVVCTLENQVTRLKPGQFSNINFSRSGATCKQGSEMDLASAVCAKTMEMRASKSGQDTE